MRVVFFTGAGLSADSGVATFRGDDGLYAGIRAEEFLSSANMRLNPVGIHRFCDDLRVRLGSVEPNAAHRMIADYKLRHPDTVVISQNVDDLLERAGCEGVIHLHGFLREMRSIGNSKVAVDIGYRRYWDGSADLAPPQGFRFRCPKSNSFMRPHVVLFNEPAPEYARMHKAFRGLTETDAVVVIGTQGSVLPVADYVRDLPCLRILNNLHPSPHIDPRAFDIVLEMRAAAAAEQILQALRQHRAKGESPRIR